MHIVVLIKPVPEPETRLRPSPDATRLDPEGVKWVLAGYDESAVEQALLFKDSLPGTEVRALTLAPAPRGEEVLRSALALGVDAATWVEVPAALDLPPIVAAQALAHVVGRYPHDLVLAGAQSGDDESGLVPSAIAEFLGSSSADAAVDLRWVLAAAAFTYERGTEAGNERIQASAPLVVALKQAWNDPRTAKLPNILKSRKMPIEKIPWNDIAPAVGSGAVPVVERKAFSLPPPRRGAKMIEYRSPEEAAAKLVKALREDAKVLP